MWKPWLTHSAHSLHFPLSPHPPPLFFLISFMLGSESGPRLKHVHIWGKFMSAHMSVRMWVRIKAWRIRRSQKWNVLNYHSPFKTLSANCPNRYSQMKSLASAFWQVIFWKKKCSFIKCGNDFIPISTATFFKTGKNSPLLRPVWPAIYFLIFLCVILPV